MESSGGTLTQPQSTAQRNLFFPTQFVPVSNWHLLGGEGGGPQPCHLYPVPSPTFSQNYSEMQPTKNAKGRQCLICGQPSFFNYYKTQCCEGCKQFFRRVLLKRETYLCPKSSRCDIKKGAKCQSCRLDRCLLAGMDPMQSAVPYSVEEHSQFLRLLNERKAEAQEMLSQRRETTAHEQEMFLRPKEVSDRAARRRQNVKRISRAALDQVDEVMRAYLCEDPFENWETAPARDVPIPPQKTDNFAEMHRTLGHLADLERKVQMQVGDDLAYEYGFLENAESLQAAMEQGIATLKQLCPPNAPSTLDTRTIRPHFLVKYFVAGIEMLRRMPAALLLDSADKVCLINSCGMVFVDFVIRCESVQRNSTVFEWPCGTPLLLFRSHPLFANDKIVQLHVDQLYLRSMKEFVEAKLCSEEFLLLLAIILSHSAIGGLSARGKLLLHGEMERYGRTLMQFVRNKYGELGGIKRYAELINLMNASFMMAHKTHEFLSYCDIVVDQGILRATIPKILLKMCFHGTD